MKMQDRELPQVLSRCSAMKPRIHVTSFHLLFKEKRNKITYLPPTTFHTDREYKQGQSTSFFLTLDCYIDFIMVL